MNRAGAVRPPSPRASRGAGIVRRLLAFGAIAALAGCATVANLSSAGRPLATYELTALPARSAGASGGRHLVVEAPTTSGTLATDRIAVRRTPLQVAYLPGARWTDPAPEHLQLLLARSLEGSGAYALVSTGGARPDPDWFLVTDLQAFEVVIAPAGEALVTVRLRATLISDVDRSVRGSRIFTQSAAARDTRPEAVIPAFDRAVSVVLRDVVDWTMARAR